MNEYEYKKIEWVDVPDPLNPPENAKALSPRNLSQMDEGVFMAHEKIRKSVELINTYRTGTYSGVSSGTFTLEGYSSTYEVSFPLGDISVNRVTVYLKINGANFILYINKNDSAVQKGFYLGGRNYVSNLVWGNRESFSLEIGYDFYIENPYIDDYNTVHFTIRNRTDDKDDFEYSLCWENS